METPPKISIVINNYNYERFLPQSIDSALAQTYAQVEVLVVDDCSTDSSRDIIESYGDRIIPILHETNGKQGAAFNSGFAKSQGDIIIFLDADDFLYPHAAEKIAEVWQPDLAKVHYRLQVVDGEGQARDFSYPQGNQLDRGNICESVLNVGTYIGVPTSGNALTRKALAHLMPISQEFTTTSDDYLSVLMPLYGEVAAVDTPLGGYRIHTSNQWAMSEVSSERFHRFIHHDLQRCELIQQHGQQLGHEVPKDLYMRFFGRAWSRLASLKLDPQTHPVPSDNAIGLAYQGIRSLWLYSSYNWQKRLIFSLWFFWVGLMPKPLAKPAIVWLFAPQLRPKLAGQVLTKLKQLVNASRLTPVQTKPDSANS
ncbi:MAG: glycosyltransferase family 2 protein [Leptolyngbyaceae cyanobacterium]